MFRHFTLISGHSTFAIDIYHKDRGKGYWKFNCELLSNIDFVNKMNEYLDTLIDEKKDCYPLDAWEQIKLAIAKFSQKYTRERNKDKQLAISQLIEVVNNYESNLPLKEQEYTLLEQSKQELETLVQENIKSIIFRSKCQWYEEGEKNTKYFYSLEKARYNAKTCQTLIDENDKEIRCDEEILKMQREFYAELYSEDVNVDFVLENHSSVKVSPEQKKLQQSEITFEELGRAAKSMKNNKTPGPDGIPVDFYKTFWKRVGPILLRVYETAYQDQNMVKSSMLGILNLIPKPNKDSRYLKNLRPITLLNADYKLVEKVIYYRMLPAMHDIIHNDQKGFLPGRRISGNIRKIFDLINYAESEQIEAIVLNLDWEKCFDRISLKAIYGALDFFEFSSFIKNWTEILYSNFQLKVQ